jgi:hypothetical protein
VRDSTSLFEAEALAAIQRVTSHATATSHALTEETNALEMTAPSDLGRQLRKAAELHRLLAAQLAGLLRQLGEGTP